MFCSKCGAQNSDTSSFCQNCGSPLVKAVFTQPDQQTQFPESGFAQESNSAADNRYSDPGQDNLPKTGIPQQPYQQQPYQQQPYQQQPYQQQPYQQQPYQQQPYQQQPYRPQPNQQQPYQQQYYNNNFPPVTMQNEIGMKWFKFLIYFALFASAVLNVISAIQYFTGSVYTNEGSSPELVYRMIPGLKAVDIIYGIALVAIAGLAVYARFMLAGYKKIGPILLYALSGASVGVYLIYIIAVSIILSRYGVGTGELITSAISSIVGSGIFLAINIIYFKKRSHLFVN